MEKKRGKGVPIFSGVLYTQKKHFLLNGGQGLISTGFNAVRFYKRTENKTPEKNEKIRNEKKTLIYLLFRL